MSNLTFYIIDVFTEEKYAGNQLAVFRGGAALSGSEMQRIAREMNFSETTFIISETEQAGGYAVRIFTPNEEVPFAGHPTLGTAHIIRSEILGGQADRVTLNVKAGQIPVTFSSEPGGIAWMKQIEPVFGQQLDRTQVASVLNLSPAEIDARFPIEEVSTGLPFIITPLKSLSALQKAKVNLDRLFALIEHTWAKGILVFCPEAHSQINHISVRVFVDEYGIPEDPATGSGNGCLAGYLVRHRYWGQTAIEVTSEQGYEIGRPSLLYLKADEQAGKITVWVGGKSITIAKGQFA
jgi:trans-2,3-dihydro-3-hydroxyanthranilate isomerase